MTIERFVDDSLCSIKAKVGINEYFNNNNNSYLVQRMT
jgi:hypothetical protein